MDGFSWNKLFAGLLVSLIVLKLGGVLSEHLMESMELEKNSFVIDVQALEQKDDSASDGKDQDAPDITPFLVKANVENGEKVFKKCLQCHTINKGGMHKIGPNLWGVVLKSYAHADDFAYSSAMKDHHDKDKWTYDNLNHFLYKPKKHIPNTKMSFVGIKDDQERADLILYLRSQSDQLAPLA